MVYFYRQYLEWWFADMYFLANLIKEIVFLLSVIYISSNYAWVVPPRNKKGITITSMG